MNASTINTNNRTFMLTLTALFAAVLAVGSWISVPLPFTPIPINLGTLAVMITGSLLGWKYGTLSVLIYVLLGTVGVPVFAGFTGGLGHIAGPTGGYIIGYITSALICGIIMDLFYDDGKWWITVIAALLGTSSCYLLGTIWFMILTKNTLAASLSMCVIPFLPGDMFKIIVAAITVPLLKKALSKTAAA